MELAKLYITPATPANAAEIMNAESLYLVTLIPVALAAISLSLIAVIALPCLERIKFCITARQMRMNAKMIMKR